jgi:putative ABC transport system ATP-binding protein
MAARRARASSAYFMISVRSLEQPIEGNQYFALPVWDVAEQSEWLITGPQGASLIHLLTGLTLPTAGEIIVQERNIAALPPAERDFMRGDIFGIAFQHARLLPALTVMQNMQVARSMSGKGDSEQAYDAALRALGVDSLKDRKPHQLSPEQAQLAAIARAVVTDPKVLICEAPTSNLSDEAADALITLLKTVCRYRKLALLIFSSDPRLQGQLRDTLTLALCT